MGDFLLGLLISVLLGAAAFFILRSNAFRRFTRHQKAAAVEACPVGCQTLSYATSMRQLSC